MQVHAKLELLTSPGMKMDAFRSARAYDLWQLAELAQDEACKNEILSSDFGPNAVFLLQDAQFPSIQAAAAVLIRRLVANSPEHGQQLTNCGGSTPHCWGLLIIHGLGHHLRLCFSCFL